MTLGSFGTKLALVTAAVPICYLLGSHAAARATPGHMFPGALVFEALLLAVPTFFLGRKIGYTATWPAAFGGALGGWLTFLLTGSFLSALAGRPFIASLGSLLGASFNSSTGRFMMTWYVGYPLAGAVLGVLSGAARRRCFQRRAVGEGV